MGSFSFPVCRAVGAEHQQREGGYNQRTNTDTWLLTKKLHALTFNWYSATSLENWWHTTSLIYIYPTIILCAKSEPGLKISRLKHRTDLPAPHHRWVWYMAFPRDWTLPTSTLQRPTHQTWWRSRPQTQTLLGASAAGSMPVCSGSTHYKHVHKGNDKEKETTRISQMNKDVWEF